LPDHLMLKSTPEPGPWFEQVAVRSPATTEENTPSTSLPPKDSQSSPLPTAREDSEPAGPMTPEEANWVVVIHWATLHSAPTVSAPIVGSYSVGTELQLIDHQQGWFRVLDPVTSQVGWIYEKYYLQAIRGPGQGAVALEKPTKQTVVNAGNSTPRVRRAKSLGPRPNKKTRPIVAAAPRHRYETVASILDTPLRP